MRWRSWSLQHNLTSTYAGRCICGNQSLVSEFLDNQIEFIWPKHIWEVIVTSSLRIPMDCRCLKVEWWAATITGRRDTTLDAVGQQTGSTFPLETPISGLRRSGILNLIAFREN